jgi:hypothetical protein
VWKPRLESLSATAYSLLTWCPRAYRIKYRQGRDLKWGRGDYGGAGGADLGSLVHWALRGWNFEPGTIADWLPEEADVRPRGAPRVPAWLEPAWKRRANRDAGRRWMEEFSRSDECERLKGALSRGELMREVYFSVLLGPVRITGSIDVYWEDGDGAHVRDWKTTPEGDAPHEMYAAQLEFYAAACMTARRFESVDAGLIYLRSGDGQATSSPVGDLGALERAITAAAELASGAGEMGRGDCARCPFISFGCGEKSAD